MPFTSLLQRLKLRHKLTALGVVGMGLCLLSLWPLVQVLRQQGLELHWARSAQHQAEPALLAVSLQRGLVEHRASAAQVLSGQAGAQAEAIRRDHQFAVDARLAMLDHRLALGNPLQAQTHTYAQRETQALHGDWLVLVQRIVTARCDAADSDSAHQLLVEQTLQIIDLVSAGLHHGHPGQPGAADPALAAITGALPRAMAGLLALPRHAQRDQALQTLVASSASLEVTLRKNQDGRQALAEAQRSLAWAGLLAVSLTAIGLLAWLRRAWAQAAKSGAEVDASSRLPTWQQPWADGQGTAGPQQMQQRLLQRLRKPREGGASGSATEPAPAAAPAPASTQDQPTEPHEPGRR